MGAKELEMQLGMIGLGRMGANMVRRLLRAGHTCVVFDPSPEPVRALAAEGATGTASMAEFVERLTKPRAVWLMVPAAVVDDVLEKLTPRLEPGDIVVDGGNSHYQADIARAKRLAEHGIHYVDCGTSGGVWGLERGYCLMIGGEPEAVRRLGPVFGALAPGRETSRPAASRSAPSPPPAAPPPASPEAGRTAESGWLHCGPSGAGHFVKMVHNGIEYGIMAAYAEGLNILQHANAGKAARTEDAETAPLLHPEHYQYDFDLAAITEVWRHGSVISSWLLDLTAAALRQSPALSEYSGHVADSGEGRWTLAAALDEGVPAYILAAALYSRLDSRGLAGFQNQVLSAMRHAFGGHLEPPR